jgi:hypothetical protein
VQLHTAAAAELEFGRDITLGSDGPRYLAQLTKKGVSIARRDGDAGLVAVMSPVVPVEHGPGDPCTLAVERQPDAWWVFLDEKPVGSVPVLPEPTASTISLGAEEGEAWFSDIILQALGTPQAEPAS